MDFPLITENFNQGSLTRRSRFQSVKEVAIPDDQFMPPEWLQGKRHGKNGPPNVKHRIKQYPLEQGALEIEFIEEFFGEFDRKKRAAEIVKRLEDRSHLILIAEAPLPQDASQMVPFRSR